MAADQHLIGYPDGFCLFESGSLLPEAWQLASGQGPVWIFNPAIIEATDGYLLAYRVVLHDGRRQLAVCRLGRDLQVRPQSAIPLSDFLVLPAGWYPEQGRNWFADPRLIRWQGRLLVHWNSGMHKPANHQFVQELDSETLTPIGTSRELRLVAGQAPIEKNWGLFGWGDELYGLYSPAPLCIIRLENDDGRIWSFAKVQTHHSHLAGYIKHFGALRGGSPPVLQGGQLIAFCHSQSQTSQGIRYHPSAVRFAGPPDFKPNAYLAQPLELPNPFADRLIQPRLNPQVAEVIYPSGAVFAKGRWLVSYGINDEHCALMTFDSFELDRHLRPARGATRAWIGSVLRRNLSGWFPG